MKYKCDNPKCGHIFDEDEMGTYKEYHNEIEGGFYEELPCCPMCGCEDFFVYEDNEDEDEGIEDGEINVESFNFVVQVRYIGYHTRTMRNAYYYAGDTKEAETIVEMYSRYKGVKVIRVYELRSEVRL